MSTHAARTEAPAARRKTHEERAAHLRKITPDQALAAYRAAGRVLDSAARTCGVHVETFRKALQSAGEGFGETLRPEDIPPQFRPTYDVCAAKVGRAEAMRIIRDHMARRM